MIQGVPVPTDQSEPVCIMVSEAVAREFERKMLHPVGQTLALPVVFSDDDLPTYIIIAPSA